ncbi:MAG: hypothetical protein LPK80_07370 [Bacteroidota bacterium]|nr:hypothetical protein [Bacteroidota bacterium]MDX5447734.1 hypothetical protein [Bacteroidota bacterium]
MIDSFQIQKGVIIETYEGPNTKWKFIEGPHLELSKTNYIKFNGYKIYSPEDGSLPTVLFSSDEIDSGELMNSLIWKYNKFSSEVSLNDFQRVSPLTQLRILLVGLKMEDFSTNFWEKKLQYFPEDGMTHDFTSYKNSKDPVTEEMYPDWFHCWLLREGK